MPVDFMESEKVFHDVKTTQPITESQVSCQLCSAFEGGSNYWIRDVRTEGVPDGEWEYLHDIPLIKGGVLWISVYEGDEGPHRLDWESLVKGLITMAKKYPRHFGDMVRNEGDAATGDVFLQCCLFDDVIYG